MNVISERSKIREVAAAWRKQYSGPHWAGDKRKAAIQAALDKLDPETATADIVAEIIGNDSWVRKPECHECGETVSVAVQIGEELDDESSTATICANCLAQALRMVKGDS